MAPWAGRVRDGLITSAAGVEHQLPTNIDPPHAIHGFGITSSWQEIGPGRSLLHLPKPYQGATVEQTIEVLDDAIRWSLEYDDNGCDLPFWLGMHPWFPRDDAFTEILGTPAVVWEGVARIDIESDAPWWVVYTEDPDGICIEPQTAPPDAANLGISGENYIEALFVFSEG